MNATIIAPDQDGLERCVAALRSGEVVVIPTDTVYGVAAHIGHPEAIAALYRIKGRDYTKPIPVLCSDLDSVRRIAREFPEHAERLADRYWPGGLTIVVHAVNELPAILLSGGNTVGIRIPDDTTARTIIRAAGGALAVTSANPSGGPEARTAGEAAATIGDRVTLILDGGPAPGGRPSTVVDVSGADGPKIYRHGAIPQDEILRLLDGGSTNG